MKIYIIGPPGSGKTTLSKSLAKKYNTKFYELDKIIYDDDNNHVKRTNEEIEKLFEGIIFEKSWIIEDVGRSEFINGREQADIIYYLKIPRRVVYKRLITRWIKQKLGKEGYNYPPTLHEFMYMLRITICYFKKETIKIESLKKYKDKVVYLGIKEINDLESR